MKYFLYSLVILIPIVIGTIIDYFFFSRTKRAVNIIKNSLKIFFLVNLFNMMVFYNIYNYGSILNPDSNSYLFFLYYFLQSLAILGIYFLIKFLLNKYFSIEKAEIKNKAASISLYIFSLFLFALGVLGFSATQWERRMYSGSTADQIFITMMTPITGTDPKILLSFVEGPVLITASLTFIFALIFYARVNLKFSYKNKNKNICSELANSIIGISLASSICLSGLGFTFWGFQLDKIFISYFSESSFIKDNYVDPLDVKISVPEKKRNLIHIYLESIENTYLDKANGGAMEENLLPNLTKLYSDGYNFSNLGQNQGFGGPLRTYGATFSCGSMVNQFFGLPMKIPSQIGEYRDYDKFLPGAIGVGDILNAHGYKQTLMLGTDADFGGLSNMFSYHGDFKIFDYKYMLENGVIPKGYKTNWGIEDNRLYEIAKEEITNLANDGPFHFVMENADTHTPGFSFEGEEPIFGETSNPIDYGKTVKYSEKNVYSFIKWIQAQPFYKDTTIVIIGDHNSMDGTLIKNLDENYIRTTYNLILNPSENVKQAASNRFYDRRWASFDMMPTILSSIGFKIQGERLGLGTNLFSDVPTIYERLDYEMVNDNLVCRSDYFNETFVESKRKYKVNNL